MTIQEMITRYGLYISEAHANAVGVRNVSILKKDNAFAAVKSHKAEIIEEIRRQKDEKEAAFKERQAKIKAIEGLEEIETAIADERAWLEEFNRSFDDVGGFGVRNAPTADVNALKAKYPRAAAYLMAEGWSNAHSVVKASAGKKALERIINGDDYQLAIADMQHEYRIYLNKTMFER